MILKAWPQKQDLKNINFQRSNTVRPIRVKTVANVKMRQLVDFDVAVQLDILGGFVSGQCFESTSRLLIL